MSDKSSIVEDFLKTVTKATEKKQPSIVIIGGTKYKIVDNQAVLPTVRLLLRNETIDKENTSKIGDIREYDYGVYKKISNDTWVPIG